MTVALCLGGKDLTTAATYYRVIFLPRTCTCPFVTLHYVTSIATVSPVRRGGGSDLLDHGDAWKGRQSALLVVSDIELEGVSLAEGTTVSCNWSHQPLPFVQRFRPRHRLTS